MPAALPNTPKVVYGSGPTTLLFSIPQRPWEPVVSTVGGTEWSGAGVPATFRISARDVLKLRLRFMESEWPAVRAWILAVQMGGAYQWFNDQNDLTSLAMYHDAPAVGQDFGPSRGEFPGEYALEVTARSTTDAAVDARYWP